MHKPDDITAKDAGGNFSPHPEGLHPMICVDVVDLGPKVESFGGETFESHKLALVFVSGAKAESGEPIYVTREMTNSMGEKANLRKFLEAWRGKSYRAEEAQQGVPIHKLHGQRALINVEHVLTKRGKTFAKISSVSPLPKEMTPPDGSLLSAYTRPKFLTDRKAQYAEDVRKFRATGGAHEPEAPAEDDDSSLPF